MTTSAIDPGLGHTHPTSSIALFARPALGFAGSTLLAIAAMVLVSMI
jgi:hypothetical protein